MTNAKTLLDSILYPPNIDVGGDTFVQVAVIARAVAEDVEGSRELLDGAHACVNLARVAKLVAGAGGRLALTPEVARACVDADDDRIQALAHRAIGEAVGDEAELDAPEIDPDAGALVLVVGVLLHVSAGGTRREDAS